MKGAGDAAVQSIIKNAKHNGAYQDIFDFAKRLNQRCS
ncbi:MAG: hypothetical protein QM734_02190 [Cyclobacteriaceae bacterium]